MAPWTITYGRSHHQAETDDTAYDYLKRIEKRWAIMIPESCILSPQRLRLVMKRTGAGVWNLGIPEGVVLLKSTCYQDTRLVSSMMEGFERPLITISSKSGPAHTGILGFQDSSYDVNDIYGNLIAETICNLPPQRKTLATTRKAIVYIESRPDPSHMNSLLMERIARWVTIKTPEGVVVAIMSFGAMTKDYKNGLFSGAIDVQILRLHDITALAVAFDIWQSALSRRRSVELARKEALKARSSSNSTRRE